MGGLLLWKDPENFLRLDCGVYGEWDLLFRGRVGKRERDFGRGRLAGGRDFRREEAADGPLASPQIFLRLEWQQLDFKTSQYKGNFSLLSFGVGYRF
jgi:hypothetical protein